MKYSQLLGKIRGKDIYSDNNSLSDYLVKVGIFSTITGDRSVYLPLGLRIINNIKLLIKEELENFAGQEVLLPQVVSSDLLEQSNRFRFLANDLLSFKDIKSGKNMVISNFFEELCAELIKKNIYSTKELPLVFYQFSKKIRSANLSERVQVDSTEFLGLDIFSIHQNFMDSNNYFPKVNRLLTEVLEKFFVKSYMIETRQSECSVYKSIGLAIDSNLGKDKVLYCSKCGYVAQEAIACCVKDKNKAKKNRIEKIFTPGVATVDELAQYFEIDKSFIGKSILFRTLKGFVLAVVSGDTDVSVQKLAKTIDDVVVRVASDIEISALELEKGYMSPIGLKDDKLKIVVDDIIVNTNNLIFGANEKGYHYKNVNYKDDFEVSIVADISMARVGDKCIQCHNPLNSKSILEIVRLSKFPEEFSKKMKLYANHKNKKALLFMNSYFLDIDKLFMAIAESNFKAGKIVWPPVITPFKYFIICIGITLKSKKIFDTIYSKIFKDALYDDRAVSVGEKFSAFESLGLPYRIVISDKKSTDDEIEIFSSLDNSCEDVQVENFLNNI